jgi:hypothetical protein
MPAKGGFDELSEAEVAAAVAYTVHSSRRVVARLKRQQRSGQCHPVRSPEKCSESELREVLTLHMFWLLGGDQPQD